MTFEFYFQMDVCATNTYNIYGRGKKRRERKETKWDKILELLNVGKGYISAPRPILSTFLQVRTF